MFLFTDAHVANESFLELINNMLTSGMIPALYDDGEKDALISGIREEVPLLPTTPHCSLHRSCFRVTPHLCIDSPLHYSVRKAQILPNMPPASSAAKTLGA